MHYFNLRIIGTPSEFGNTSFLESFRFKTGIPFPNSYKEFTLKYGYGIALEQFHIYIPMDNYGDSWNIRTEEIKSTYYKDVINNDIWFDLEPDGSVDLLKRLVPFASSNNGYYLFWDLNSFFNNELDIYITDFRGSGFIKIGHSLFDLINKLTSSEEFNHVMPFLQKPLRNTFVCLEKKH